MLKVFGAGREDMSLPKMYILEGTKRHSWVTPSQDATVH